MLTNIAKPMKTEIVLAAMTTGCEAVRMSTSGLGMRSSSGTKKPSSSRPAAKQPSVRTSSHPQSLPVETARSSSTSARLSRTAPRTSKAPAVRTLDSETVSRTSAIISSARTPGNQSTTCQSKASAR